MADTETRDRVRALLAAKRGSELLDAIADEIASLDAQVRRLSDRVHQLPMFQSFAERLCLLEEAGAGQGQLPNKIGISAAHLFATENGFYGMEYESNGRPYRWTGPRRDFAFSLYLDRSAPLRLRLDVARVIDRSRQTSLVLLVDGSSLPMQLVVREDGLVGEAILPARSGPRATSLVFVLSCVLRPPMGTDTRPLGLAFRSLRIGPLDDVNFDAPVESASSDSAASGIETGRPALVSRAFVDQTTEREDSTSPEEHLPQQVYLDASLLEGDSDAFFALEYDEQHRPYRWTGPAQTFSLRASVDRSNPLQLTLCVVQFVDRARQTPLVVEVDNESYQLNLVDGADGVLAKALIGPSARREPTVFEFTVPVTLKPAGAEQRQLGVAFRYLRLEPPAPAVSARRATIDELVAANASAHGVKAEPPVLLGKVDRRTQPKDGASPDERLPAQVQLDASAPSGNHGPAPSTATQDAGMSKERIYGAAAAPAGLPDEAAFIRKIAGYWRAGLQKIVRPNGKYSE